MTGSDAAAGKFPVSRPTRLSRPDESLVDQQHVHERVEVSLDLIDAACNPVISGPPEVETLPAKQCPTLEISNSGSAQCSSGWPGPNRVRHSQSLAPASARTDRAGTF